ncbi:hypothetical protein EIP91_004228 [Steccherinum ochraceum]|uniref:Uncharacterized protein n=1 Tax=Steccherinum ochraceum TaxID=92696 RepID=A0A4R0RHQ8_9APHY|nr:hypothetical protein EIP91_004228 [Steccherinum ochraceum]
MRFSTALLLVATASAIPAFAAPLTDAENLVARSNGRAPRPPPKGTKGHGGYGGSTEPAPAQHRPRDFDIEDLTARGLGRTAPPRRPRDFDDDLLVARSNGRAPRPPPKGTKSHGGYGGSTEPAPAQHRPRGLGRTAPPRRPRDFDDEHLVARSNGRAPRPPPKGTKGHGGYGGSTEPAPAQHRPRGLGRTAPPRRPREFDDELVARSNGRAPRPPPKGTKGHGGYGGATEPAPAQHRPRDVEDVLEAREFEDLEAREFWLD